MDKATKMHLEEITPEALEFWKQHKAFISFASSTGKNGHIELGVNGTGFYAVKQKKGMSSNTTYYMSEKEAIKQYAELLS
jgi:hypothetical protein